MLCTAFLTAHMCRCDHDGRSFGHTDVIRSDEAGSISHVDSGITRFTMEPG